MKVFLACMGPGETAQAAFFARHLEQMGDEVVFGLESAPLVRLLGAREGEPAPYTFYITQNPLLLIQAVAAEKPDRVLFFNSKMFRLHLDFRMRRPTGFPRAAATVDSNWLFRREPTSIYPFLEWVDRHFIILPTEIFQAGLKEGGGDYGIESEIQSKMDCVGLLPSSLGAPSRDANEIKGTRSDLGMASENAKLVFAYAGYGTTEKNKALIDYLERAIELPETHLALIGPKDLLPLSLQENSRVHRFEGLSTSKFLDLLRASDLVIQHQGLGTLAQAIAAEIPVIANVSDDPQAPGEHAHQWELAPFAKKGACALHQFSDSKSSKASSLERLLFDRDSRAQMKAAQSSLRAQTEQNLYRLVQNLT